MTSAATKYLPSAWLDEMNPETQSDPTAFLKHQTAPGHYLMEPVHDPEDWTNDAYHVAVQVGQVVPFLTYRSYGTHIMTVAEDGRADAPTVPADANCFILDHEADTFTSDLQEIADNGIDATGDPLTPGNYEIQAWFWSDTETHFRLVEQDGKPVFEPCAGPN